MDFSWILNRKKKVTLQENIRLKGHVGFLSGFKIQRKNVETSDLNPRVMCTSKSNKKTAKPS